jgi:hypothetical protein
MTDKIFHHVPTFFSEKDSISTQILNMNKLRKNAIPTPAEKYPQNRLIKGYGNTLSTISVFELKLSSGIARLSTFS